MRAGWIIAGLMLLAPVAHAETVLQSPRLIPEKSQPFKWSADALKARAQGLAYVRCSLTVFGHPLNCRVVHGVAHVRDAELVTFAEGLVFTPAIGSDGLPIFVKEFEFPVRLVPPKVPALPVPIGRM